VWGDVYQLTREIRRIIIFSAINLLIIKKEGLISLILDRLSITVYFSFLASLKKYYLTRTREGTCKNILIIGA